MIRLPKALLIATPGLLAVLVLVLVGCGPSDEPPAASALPASAAPQTPQQASADVTSRTSGPVTIQVFLGLGSENETAADQAFKIVASNWQNANVPVILELLRFVGDPKRFGRLVQLLEQNTGQSYGRDINAWYRWVWAKDFGTPANYVQFKAKLYAPIDPRFANYFRENSAATIRLDEILWGGVRRDGIPPLSSPKMIDPAQATYLQDDNVVFGIEINGDVRAYPKRIVAWHEMFKDTVGGVSVNGVYCTLCGSMILYQTEHDGVHHELGTSGFLYRSNKLMYDRATESLWSTITGEPAVGPLVGKGIKLRPLYVVTTTWDKWRQQHPDTTVLSLETGHRRDYSEGAAYRDYFATDKLMFNVPKLDRRLRNKAEVLALRFGSAEDPPTAISTGFLSDHPICHGELGGRRFVILNDPSGANRVYDAEGQTFVAYDGNATLTDEAGQGWTLNESNLQRVDGQQTLPRLAAHRAFWFGWFAAHPDTRLIPTEGDVKE